MREQQVPEEMRVQVIGRSSIGNVIKNLGFTLKRITKQPVPRNTEVQLKKRVIWGSLFIGLVKEEPVFVFVDECGFARSQSRQYAYGEIGHSSTITVDKIRHVNNTAIAAMIVGYGMYVEVITGACNNQRFVEFCDNLIQHLKTIVPMHKSCIIVMDNAKIHVHNVFNRLWDQHIYLLKTIPYSPQTNSIEMSFSQAKKVINDIMGSQSKFQEVYTEIMASRVEAEYRTRLLSIQRRYAVIQEGDEDLQMDHFMELNANMARYTEKLRELDEWFETEMDRVTTLPENFNPHAIELTEDVFHSMIHYAFKQITIENIRHYYAHTIKVADSCIHGYPLSMSKKFYEEYTIADMDSLLIYLHYSDALH